GVRADQNTIFQGDHRRTEVTMAQTIAIERVDHIGIRVRDLDCALAFYRVLGFTLVRRAEGDAVTIIRNEHGVEINLVFNVNAGDPAANILMDIPDKFPGYTHIALRVASIPATIVALNANGIPIAGASQLWTSRGRRFRRHDGAAHADREENNSKRAMSLTASLASKRKEGSGPPQVPSLSTRRQHGLPLHFSAYLSAGASCTARRCSTGRRRRRR